MAYSHAQVSIGVQIGPTYGIYNAPPVCDYGFYPDYPFGCAPYGYYGPTWFVDGVFIGAGPWYNFYYTRPVYYRPFYFNRGFGFHSFHDRDDFRGFHDHDGFRRFRDDDRFRGERFRGSRDEDGFRRFRDGDRREGFRGDDRDRGGDRVMAGAVIGVFEVMIAAATMAVAAEAIAAFRTMVAADTTVAAACHTAAVVTTAVVEMAVVAAACHTVAEAETVAVTVDRAAMVVMDVVNLYFW